MMPISTEQRTFNGVARQCLYFVLLIGVVCALWPLTHILGRDLFYENGLLENFQCFVLMTAALLFFFDALRIKSYRIILLGLASICVLGIFRETDAFWDEALPCISWRIGFIAPITVALYAFKERKKIKEGLYHFFESPAFYMMINAMVVVIPVAQCIGHKPLIEDITGNIDMSIIRSIRRMIEESCELCGYILILCSAIEIFFNLSFPRKK